MKPIAIGDLLRTGDLEALALLDHLDEVRRVEERLVRAGVEPSGAAREHLDR